MKRILKNSAIKLRNIIKQNNKQKNKNKMKTRKHNQPLNNNKKESLFIKSLKSMIKKIVTEICIAGILALPSHMTDARTTRTIKFNAEIHISYSIQDQNGIGQ